MRRLMLSIGLAGVVAAGAAGPVSALTPQQTFWTNYLNAVKATIVALPAGSTRIALGARFTSTCNAVKVLVQLPAYDCTVPPA
jgi:hypothetical protein